jgi:hypothetical protein
MARYRFLCDHYLDRIYSAGESADLPKDWVPSGNVEPLDAEAVEMFRRFGPQEPSLIGVRPATKWEMNSSTRKWILTGLGGGK